MEVTSNMPNVTITTTSGFVPSEPTNLNWDDIYTLKGRLLTLIDATFTDAEQRKAMKDTIWSLVKTWAEDCDERHTRYAEAGEDKQKYVEFPEGGSIGAPGSGASIEVGEKKT